MLHRTEFPGDRFLNRTTSVFHTKNKHQLDQPPRMTTEFDPKTPRTDGKDAMEGNDEVPSGLGSRMYWLFNMSQPQQKPETPKVVDGRDEIASSTEARADSGRETLETDGTDDAWIAGNEVGKEKIAKQVPGHNNGSDDCGPEALEADILQRIETMRADIEKLTAVVKAQEDCCEYEDEEKMHLETINAMRNSHRDIYSFIGFNVSIRSFVFGFLVVLFQICFLVVLIIGTRHDEHDGVCFPTHLTTDTRAAQILCLVFYVLFPSSSIMDIIVGIELFPLFHTSSRDDKLDHWIAHEMFGLASCLKITLGWAAVLAAFFLVMTSPSAIAVVLRFTAVNFVSEIDNDAFSLAAEGALGRHMTVVARQINKNLDSMIPPGIDDRRSGRRSAFGFVQFLILTTLVTTSILIFAMQDDCY
ncbi:unnamed protein product [Pseudo-nitzschia multistriata]|uniref:Uncharacterized protein n=1 Tax=Pseudo-nitzschia multistriata TaxID=183589 RepID=A0A448YV58_9STRA|nr:unnamed protein product [Pseudo-nitzschia multistriata]